jgi:hypothetical protein
MVSAGWEAHAVPVNKQLSPIIWKVFFMALCE